MNTCVTFESKLFAPFLPEDSQVNPECYGAELCWWLSKELAAKGIYTTYPNFEDWGWFVEFFDNDEEFWICCGNISGEVNTWQIYILAQSEGLKGLFTRKKPELTRVKPVVDAIDQLLQETPDIENIHWRKEV